MRRRKGGGGAGLLRALGPIGMVLLGIGLVLAVGYAVKLYKPELFETTKPEKPAVQAPQTGTTTNQTPAQPAPAQNQTSQPPAQNQTQTPAQTQTPPADANKAIVDKRTQIDRSAGASSTMVVTAYYADGLAAGETLVPVEIRLPLSTSTMKEAVNQLINAPEDLKLYSNFPKGTKVLGINPKDGVATVDLSPEAAQVQGSAAAQAMRAVLVYTLTELPGVKSVQLWINGHPAVLHGIEWSKPVSRADVTGYSVAPLVKFATKP